HVGIGACMRFFCLSPSFLSLPPSLPHHTPHNVRLNLARYIAHPTAATAAASLRLALSEASQSPQILPPPLSPDHIRLNVAHYVAHPTAATSAASASSPWALAFGAAGSPSPIPVLRAPAWPPLTRLKSHQAAEILRGFSTSFLPSLPPSPTTLPRPHQVERGALYSPSHSRHICCLLLLPLGSRLRCCRLCLLHPCPPCLCLGWPQVFQAHKECGRRRKWC
ncbi:unnamed protein product, partial [Closterium sp. NIES-53]